MSKWWMHSLLVIEFDSKTNRVESAVGADPINNRVGREMQPRIVGFSIFCRDGNGLGRVGSMPYANPNPIRNSDSDSGSG